MDILRRDIQFSCMAKHGGGSSRHAVWIVGKNGNHYNVMDPYWGAPPHSNGPPYPIVPYSSSRYVDIQVWSILPVKTRP